MTMSTYDVISGALRVVLMGLEKRLAGFGNQRKNRDQIDHSFVEIG